MGTHHETIVALAIVISAERIMVIMQRVLLEENVSAAMVIDSIRQDQNVFQKMIIAVSWIGMLNTTY